MDIETKIDQILKIVTKVQQDLAAMKKEFNELKEKDIAKLKEDVKILKEEVAKLKERMTNIERSVTLIELEHGDRIRALFDYMKANDDAHERIEKSISNLKSENQVTLFNHEKRIKKLEGNLVPIL